MSRMNGNALTTLRAGLTQRQQELLAAHNELMQACQKRLEEMTELATGWRQVLPWRVIKLGIMLKKNEADLVMASRVLQEFKDESEQ